MVQSLDIKTDRTDFAVTVRGVDLRQPLDDDTILSLRAELDRCGVMIIPGQMLTDEQQVAFSERLGPLETPLARDQVAGLHKDVTRIANVAESGRVLGEDDDHAIYVKGNQLWHIDSTFKPVPARYSILSGRQVPTDGGETEFADARAAYDAWPAEFDGISKADLDGLSCEHSIVYSRSLIVGDIFTDAEKKDFAPVRQVLVRTHPATGRKSFYPGSHCSHVIGWPVEKGRALIRAINEHCVQQRFVYIHEWQAGDLVLWDNRSVMHRGRPWDHRFARVMHRTTVSDEVPTVAQEVA